MAGPLNGKLVTVFGGSGFVGRHAVRALARAGWRVRVAVRRPDLAGFLQPLGFGRADPGGAGEPALPLVDRTGTRRGRRRRQPRRYPRPLRPAELRGCAGLRRAGDRGGGAGRRHHKSDPRLGDRRRSGLPGALCAQQGPGRGRRLAAVPEAVMLRPSIVFGPEDQFFNRFAKMAQISPVLPVIGPRHALPAGLCRRRRRGHRRDSGRARPEGNHLRTRRSGGAHLPAVPRTAARRDLSQAADRAGAVLGGEAAGDAFCRCCRARR